MAEARRPRRLPPTPRAPRPSSTNRFVGTWLASIPSPFPKLYLLGIDMQQRDFEHWSPPAYLRGEWRDDGWWYYYLYACAIKVPLGLWALGALAFVVCLAKTSGFGPQTSISGRHASSCPTAHRPPPTSPRDLFVLLFPALVIFVVVSAKTEINEHMRYVLPSFPFVFIGLSGMFWNFVDTLERGHVDCQNLVAISLRRTTFPLVVTLLAWFAASSAWIYPHSLSYFNESIGGPLNGPEHLLGSNVGWGQDVRYAKSLLASPGRNGWHWQFRSEYLSVRDLGISKFDFMSPESVRRLRIGGDRSAVVVEFARARSLGDMLLFRSIDGALGASEGIAYTYRIYGHRDGQLTPP